MGRSPDAKNKNNYHYKVTDFNEDEKGVETKYINMYDIEEKYNCSRRLILYFLKDGGKITKKGKLKNLLITKIHEPVFKLVKI
jgi:hypothetical protein